MSPTEPERFTIHVPDAALADLRERLERFRPVEDFANDDWTYGFNGDYVAELHAHWLTAYDWREQERRINGRPHFRTTIDGVPVHFIHVRGTGPSPVPLILSGGWPWTFWDFHRVIGPLTDPAAHGGDPADAFDVVVPSLPGFAFSSPLRVPGMNYWVAADVWAKLMTDVLGYDRFAAHGADIGAILTAQLGHKHAERLIGIHVCGALTLSSWHTKRPWAELMAPLFERSSAALRDDLLAWERERISHLAVQCIEPQTLAYAMNDSPVGLAAWLLQRRRSWSDCHGNIERVFDKDDLITTTMIYWLTQTFATAARYYVDATRNPWVPSHGRTPVVEAPTGVSMFAFNNPPGYDPSWIGDYYNLTFRRDHPTGGHFPPIERPDTLVQDLRDMFQPLRASP